MSWKLERKCFKMHQILAFYLKTIPVSWIKLKLFLNYNVFFYFFSCLLINSEFDLKKSDFDFYNPEFDLKHPELDIYYSNFDIKKSELEVKNLYNSRK